MIKSKIIIVLLTIIMIISFSNCKKDNVNTSDISNIEIEGWKIDSIGFSYNWISPTDGIFLDSKTGYIVGTNGYFIKTTDSASFWTISNIDSTGIMTSSMSFINDTTGFIYGTWNILNGNFYGQLFKTTDGGNHWTKQHYDSAYNFHSLRFFDINHGIALNWINSGSYVLITDNGGLSWETVNLNLDPSINRLFFLGDICYATGTNLKIYKSTDYGKTWNTINVPTSSGIYIYGFYFINENIGFLDLGEKKYKTIDGGLNWSLISLPFSRIMISTPPNEYFHFCNQNEGIAVVDSFAFTGGDFVSFIGENVYTTTNGGGNWVKSSFLKHFSFGRIIFVSNNLAYCISNKYIYKLQKK